MVSRGGERPKPLGNHAWMRERGALRTAAVRGTRVPRNGGFPDPGHLGSARVPVTDLSAPRGLLSTQEENAELEGLLAF